MPPGLLTGPQPQPAAGSLDADVLYPVLRLLGDRALVMACLTCRGWARTAACRLYEQRLACAQVEPATPTAASAPATAVHVLAVAECTFACYRLYCYCLYCYFLYCYCQ